MKKQLIIIAMSFIVILGVSIGGFALVQRSPQLQNTVAKLANVQVTNSTNTAVVNRAVTSNTKLVSEAQSVARIFAERFGSTSNQDPAAQASVLVYTSDRLKTILRANIDDLISRATPSVAVTVETKAYVVDVSGLTDASATAVVATVRQETVGAAAPKITRQDLTLELIREKNTWRVDQVRWSDPTPYAN